MKTIDLRHEQVSLDDLLRSIGGDAVRITSKEGEEFVIEAADGLDREASELGRSAKFLAFLAERAAETGRISLEEVEAGLTDPMSATSGMGTGAEREPSVPSS